MTYIILDLEWNQPISYQSRTYREVGDKLIFEDEVKRPASGQSAVLYDGEICLGGGIII